MGKSSRLTIVLAGARVFRLGLVALLLTLPCDSGAGALKFAYSGFNEYSSLTVPQGKWKLNTTTGCFYFNPPVTNIQAGRLLYAVPIQVRHRGPGKVKSFIITFIYRLHSVSTKVGYFREVLSFMIVDLDETPHKLMIVDSTGTSHRFTGLRGTKEAPRILIDHESDTHTHAETSMNPNSKDHNIRYVQIWIDYSEANSSMDFYYANYTHHKQRKPATPQDHIKPDWSSLKKNMYIGFSTAKGINSSYVPHLCAWSFSNDRDPQAQSIVIAEDASPAAPPPAPAPRPPAPPPISPPQIPPSPSPSPISPSPNGGATPPSRCPVGCYLAVLVVLFCLIVFSPCWYFVYSTVWRRPLRIFISHTGGQNGSEKNFPSWLHHVLKSHSPWSRSKFHVEPFLDVENCQKGKPFAREILQELERFDVGVVVVTPDFFERHWPMTELIKFVEVQRKDREGRIRVLPLFYELQPDELKQGLDEGKWENFWAEPSEGNHPLQLQECRDAVTWLCQQTGIRYVSNYRDQDKAYIDTILKEVDKILRDERSIAADLRWVMKKLDCTRCCPPATETE